MKQIFVTILFLLLATAVIAQTGIVSSKSIDQLKEQLNSKLNEDEPGASVIITQHGKVVMEAYYGLADVSILEKLSSTHVLGIASMSKQFTGMAVLFLEQEGKLNLKDDVRKYLPELPIGDRKITIEQLLSHTSGLPELTQNAQFMNDIGQAHTVKQIIDLGLNGEFRGETGKEFIYCNTGYIITVALIERLSGMRYAEYLQKKIFAPLKMNNTYSCDFENDADKAVPRYIYDSIGFKKAVDMHFSNLIGGGGVVSNTQDMAKWGVALLSGNHLPGNYQKLWDPVLLNSGESTEYGLGMGLNEFEGKKYYYHPGMGSGMNSVNMIFPDDNLTICVIRNISKPKFSSVNIALMAAEILISTE